MNNCKHFSQLDLLGHEDCGTYSEDWLGTLAPECAACIIHVLIEQLRFVCNLDDTPDNKPDAVEGCGT
jgi:hypothetical protein